MDTNNRFNAKAFFSTQWIIGLITGIAVFVASQVGLLDGLESKAYDLGVQLATRTPGDEIVVVALGGAGPSETGAPPLARSAHAEMIEFLHQAGAKVIGYDMETADSVLDPNLQYVNELVDFLSGSSLARQAPREIDRLDEAFTRLRHRATLAADRGLARELAKLDKLYTGSSLSRKLPAEIKRLKTILRSAADTLNNTDELGKRMKKAGNVVLGMPAVLGMPSGALAPLPEYAVRDALPASYAGPPHATGLQPPGEALGRSAAGIGYTFTASDTPHDGRAIPLYLRYGDQLLPSRALVLAARFLDATGDVKILANEGVAIGRHLISTDGSLNHLSFYYDQHGDEPPFPVYPFREVAESSVPPERFRGKLVLVGSMLPSSGPRFSTPTGATMSSVMVTAHNVASLLNRDSLMVPSWADAVELSAFLVVLLYLVMALPRLRLGIGVITTLILLNVLVDTHFLLLMNQGLWVQLMTPALLLVAGQALLAIRRAVANNARRGEVIDESAENTRMLGLAFQGQGQLDMAFEKFRKCTLDDSMMDLLYNLGADYERKRQYSKAGTVYEYMAGYKPEYKDLVKRIDRARQMDSTGLLHQSGPGAANTDTFLLDVDGVEKPMLGRYQVERIIGRGAMGVIYQGRDPKINRVVAIKTLALAQEFDSDDLEEVEKRFFREAETAGRLNHPNIVTIYDAGEEQDLAYIAMEFLTGHDLTRYCKPDKLLPLAAVFHIVIKAAEALDYAHSQNVVHRDIKPGNIIFESKSGDVKITDFGIARITDSNRTRTGTVLGTPAYMSPEQLAGERIDGRSDIFSLGVMFYQLATGQLPFQADSMASLMFKITNEPHLPVISHNPDLDPCIDAIIDKALSKQKKWRFSSCAEFARDLRACARRVMSRPKRELNPTVSQRS